MKHRVIVLMAVAAIAVSVSLAQGRGGRAGRPGERRTPESPPPTIIDDEPRRTLVAPQDVVPRAKDPAIDVHSHQPSPISPEAFDQVQGMLDSTNAHRLVPGLPSDRFPH
jgi:hypothetical protein